MEIVWDEPKRAANIAKHGLDFADVPYDLFMSARIDDARADRFQALGLLEGRAVVLIFARLGTEAFSLISLRPASTAERKRL